MKKNNLLILSMLPAPQANFLKTYGDDLGDLGEQELYGFWLTFFMIKAPFSTLRYLKEIQVVPHGFKFDKSLPTACELAYFEGLILIRGDYLQIYNKQGDSREFYHYLIHEIAHQVDFEEGRKGSGFYRNEFVDKSGETQVLWEKKEEQILLDEIRPEVIKTLNARYLSEKQEESHENCSKGVHLFHTPAELGNNACISL